MCVSLLSLVCGSNKIQKKNSNRKCSGGDIPVVVAILGKTFFFSLSDSTSVGCLEMMKKNKEGRDASKCEELNHNYLCTHKNR